VLLLLWLITRWRADRETIGEINRSRWDFAVATFAAGLVAVHPVVVEPVVWIPGREELLMTLGALGTIHLHISARHQGEIGRPLRAWACHAGAACFCAAACLSNAVAAVIPVFAVAWDVLHLRRSRLLRIVLGTGPLWAISVSTIIAKRLAPGSGIATAGQLYWNGRLMIGLNAYWLQIKSLFRPNDLALHYDWLFPSGFLDVEVLLGAAAVLVTGGLVWIYRRQPLVLFGFAWWWFAMLPSLQVFPHHIHRADRFLYLPIMGLALSLAGMLESSASRAPQRVTLRVAVAMSIAMTILTALAVASRLQLNTWSDSVTTWNRCVERNPNNVRAHNVLADNLAREGRIEEAIWHYEKVLEIQPDNLETLGDFATELATVKKEFRDCSRAVKLATRACELSNWSDDERRGILGLALSARAYELQSNREFAQAIVTYEEALRVYPKGAPAMLNLALLLATCPEERFRRPQEAVRLAERGRRLLKPPDINSLLILATVYARVGRLQSASSATQEAVQMAEEGELKELARQLEQQVERYEQAAAAGGKR
jgi:tetratricopeptide (TPR) repeat protein